MNRTINNDAIAQGFASLAGILAPNPGGAIAADMERRRGLEIDSRTGLNTANTGLATANTGTANARTGLLGEQTRGAYEDTRKTKIGSDGVEGLAALLAGTGDLGGAQAMLAGQTPRNAAISSALVNPKFRSGDDITAIQLLAGDNYANTRNGFDQTLAQDQQQQAAELLNALTINDANNLNAVNINDADNLNAVNINDADIAGNLVDVLAGGAGDLAVADANNAATQKLQDTEAAFNLANPGVGSTGSPRAVSVKSVDDAMTLLGGMLPANAKGPASVIDPAQLPAIRQRLAVLIEQSGSPDVAVQMLMGELGLPVYDDGGFLGGDSNTIGLRPQGAPAAPAVPAAPSKYPEGTTATMKDGTQARMTGGQWVPLP